MARPKKRVLNWHKEEKVQVFTTVSKKIWEGYQKIEDDTGVKKCEQLFNALRINVEL